MGETMSSIKNIHLIFKTHLDVGYTDFAASVVNNYIQSYIPKAIELAARLRLDNSPNRFIWTTGSWLIYEYLEQAGSDERRRMENAITNGDITWHALPFTVHSEAMDPSLFRFGLSLSQSLDQRFGRRTIAAKMTDVPGHTRGIIPLLVEAGVEFLHIGVNAASTPPDVPPVFVWRDPSGSEVMIMYHKGSYGDLMIVPGLDEAIAFAHTSDNLGPQTAEQLQETYLDLRERFPGTDVKSSTMDAFAKKLALIKDTLPVITHEIGDTWIYGVGTDPQKVAHFRELSRLRQEWLSAGTAPEELHSFSRKLLLVPEHTWGLDVKTYLGDWENYAAEKFMAVRGEPKYKVLEASWQEQRNYIKHAVESLPPALQIQARNHLSHITPARPDLNDFETFADPSQIFQAGAFHASFDPQFGCLTRLDFHDRQLAGPDRPLGKFWYETFSASDYARFYRQYNVNKRSTKFWSIPDFTKPGIEKMAHDHRVFFPRLEWIGSKHEKEIEHYLLLLEMPEESWLAYGAPRNLALEVTFYLQKPKVSFHLQWFGKPACRLPEAAWFSFVPRIRRSNGWRMNKMGQWISPHEVIRDGSRHLHAVDSEGLSYEDESLQFGIRSLDAPLVAPGRAALLDFNNLQPNLHRGVHFNLVNNLWGTNFPMWYEDDALFRFELQIPIH